MSDFDVRREDNGKKGRYVTEVDGMEAEMTFSILSPRTIIVDHTGVPDTARGQGYANVLAEAAVADARERGHKIVPLCPFLNAWRQKHPDAADVFQV